MSVIFDLRVIDTSWAKSVNEALQSDSPVYIEENGAVGSDLWWHNYGSGNILYQIKSGVVSYVGEKIDFFNEECNIVEINFDGKLVEYNLSGYWKNSEVKVGAIVKVEFFEICVKQKYGSTTFIFECFVEVVRT